MPTKRTRIRFPVLCLLFLFYFSLSLSPQSSQLHASDYGEKQAAGYNDQLLVLTSRDRFSALVTSSGLNVFATGGLGGQEMCGASRANAYRDI